MKAQPLTAASFAPFGDVIDTSGAPDLMINDGRCGRFHDRAQLDFGGGRAGISLFQSETVTLPYTLTLLERHPLGSQAFLPTGAARLLIAVAEDAGGEPGPVHAFLSAPGQAVNLHRGIWHGVLAPLDHGVVFVVDRIGDGDNLELFDLPAPITLS